MFTPKQTAEILEIPPSTLRRYRSQWAGYLSAPDKSRQYTQDDIDTLRLIRDLIGQRKSQDEIAEILMQGPQPPFAGDVFEDEIPPGPQPQGAIQSIEFFQNIMDQLTNEHKTALTAKDAHIETLEKNQDRLQREIAWFRLPWYKKMFRDPPE